MSLELIPIEQRLEDNLPFFGNPLCDETLQVTIDFYKRVGFAPPWISYYIKQGSNLVGAAAFKGAPVNGSVEIAYGTFEPFQKQGIGIQICKALVELSLKTDPSVRITARTLPENNYSTKILKHNSFKLLGMVDDPEDGPVWEWEYDGGRN